MEDLWDQVVLVTDTRHSSLTAAAGAALELECAQIFTPGQVFDTITMSECDRYRYLYIHVPILEDLDTGAARSCSHLERNRRVFAR